MKTEELHRILSEVGQGSIPVSEAMGLLRRMSFADIEFAKVDTGRQARTGEPEAIYCDRKSPSEIAQIADTIATAGSDAIMTRLETHKVDSIARELGSRFRHFPVARLGVFFSHENCEPRLSKRGRIAVLTAGTSDIPVAEEAALTAWILGAEVDRFWDVGVAGIHRLQSALPALQSADVVVAVAGMDGALPSVVGGLVTAPVVAVPTSVGYGASFGGVAALLTMLNTCAPGVTVVNIDNGFGAAVAAVRMASLTMTDRPIRTNGQRKTEASQTIPSSVE